MIFVLIFLFCSFLIADPISKLSYHNFYGKDSVVLKDLDVFYSKIEIYRNGKILLMHTTDELEISTDRFGVFNEINGFYIFTKFSAPDPNSYIVFKSDKNGVKLIGEVPKNTGIIMGDLNYDGCLEIGGYDSYDNGSIQVYKVCESITKDEKLRNSFKRLIFEMSKK